MHATLLGHCGDQAPIQAIALPQSLRIAHRCLCRRTPRLFEAEPLLHERLGIVAYLEAGDARRLEAHLNDARTRAIIRVDVVRRQVDMAEIPDLEPVKAP